jgi:oxalate decarboxylase/phosphoglucose isomerase-like protein (cupin superfamily)
MEAELKEMMASLERTGYCQWMKSEGIPVVEGFSVEDVRALELSPWRRLGGKGAFVNLYGMEGQTGMYVAEIPPGGALNPERHMYEEMICILTGQGATEVWQEGGKKQLFEWEPWSLFAPPLNTWHRLVNGGREPVRLIAVTTAPIALDFYRNPEFIFNCPFTFSDRFSGEEHFFETSQKFYAVGLQSIWETNFIPDAKDIEVQDDLYVKGTEVGLVQFETSKNALIGHVADWPIGLYHKVHYHGGGAVIVILKSQGYTLLWPKEIGTQPYATGRSEEVVELRWREGSVLSPPGGWFHQHFNIGKEAARQLALRYGSKLFPIGLHQAAKKKTDGVYISVKKGGTMIEYEDEDAEIRRRYEAKLKRLGTPLRMRA